MGDMVESDNLSGRLVVTTALDQHLEKFPALISLSKEQFKCQRCQMVNQKSLYSLTADVFYCPDCLVLGRLTNQDYLLAYPEQNNFKIPLYPLSWRGTLTPKQQQISQKLCQVQLAKQEHLVWAVTGSGKTEMLFAMIAQAVSQGERIALAAPRVDVCNELYPRIQAAFNQVSVSLLHGQGASTYQYSQILICTVHQLLKFRAAFDLLVLDECDSYPYINNPLLHQAVLQAVKPRHCLIYLSATPSPEYLTRIQAGQLN
ncbi:DEAD/DEAH box helicase, partial [Lactobacillus sp. XV13L]|nr:DEAD/DEAH box helicase [Lactobacillus sp. XV13L]